MEYSIGDIIAWGKGLYDNYYSIGNFDEHYPAVLDGVDEVGKSLRFISRTEKRNRIRVDYYKISALITNNTFYYDGLGKFWTKVKPKTHIVLEGLPMFGPFDKKLKRAGL